VILKKVTPESAAPVDDDNSTPFSLPSVLYFFLHQLLNPDSELPHLILKRSKNPNPRHFHPDFFFLFDFLRNAPFPFPSPGLPDSMHSSVGRNNLEHNNTGPKAFPPSSFQISSSGFFPFKFPVFRGRRPSTPPLHETTAHHDIYSSPFLSISSYFFFPFYCFAVYVFFRVLFSLGRLRRTETEWGKKGILLRRAGLWPGYFFFRCLVASHLFPPEVFSMRGSCISRPRYHQPQKTPNASCSSHPPNPPPSWFNSFPSLYRFLIVLNGRW